MKTWKFAGEVSRHEKTKIRKKVSEGIGEAKKSRIVEEDAFVLVVLGRDGERARFTKDTAFEADAGDFVNVKLEYDIQTKLEQSEDEARIEEGEDVMTGRKKRRSA
jgi:hypothetical protein